MTTTWRTLRKWWVVIGATLVCVGVLVTADARSPGGGYVFSNIDVSRAPYDSPHPNEFESARVKFDLAWEGSSYPGERNCVWTVYDTNGTPLGTESLTISGMASSYSGLTEDVPLQIDGHPASADASCDGVRRDDAGARFRVSDVRFAPVDPKNIEIHFNVTSSGGAPPPSACDLQVYGRSGTLLLSHNLNVFTDRLDTVPISKVVGRPGGWSEPPGRVAVDCTPF